MCIQATEQQVAGNAEAHVIVWNAKVFKHNNPAASHYYTDATRVIPSGNYFLVATVYVNFVEPSGFKTRKRKYN
jgi:hypothetical protein